MTKNMTIATCFTVGLALQACAEDSGPQGEADAPTGGMSADDGKEPTTGPQTFPSELLPETVVPELEPIIPPEGGTALFSGIVEVKPGEDVTYCTFMEGTTEAVSYVHDTKGVQSQYGHHAILYYTTELQEPGTRDCGDMESLRQILGGTGGETADGGGVKLPPNVVSEIPAGAQLVLNHHWINYGEKPTDVQAMLVTVPPESTDDLVIARSMALTALGFQLPPGEVTEYSAECEFQSDVPAIAVLGHEHEWGTWVKAEKISGDGKTEVLFDYAYTAEMTSNPNVYTFPVDEPLMFHTGDRLRMTCEWMNDTAETITFPREMCVFFANVLTDDDMTCVNGRWL